MQTYNKCVNNSHYIEKLFDGVPAIGCAPSFSTLDVLAILITCLRLSLRPALNLCRPCFVLRRNGTDARLIGNIREISCCLPTDPGDRRIFMWIIRFVEALPLLNGGPWRLFGFLLISDDIITELPHSGKEIKSLQLLELVWCNLHVAIFIYCLH